MKRWLWFHIGEVLWRIFARTQPRTEVYRLLEWMSLGCIENTTNPINPEE